MNVSESQVILKSHRDEDYEHLFSLVTEHWEGKDNMEKYIVLVIVRDYKVDKHNSEDVAKINDLGKKGH